LILLALGIVTFALLIGIGMIVLQNMADMVVSCENVGEGSSAFNTTSQLCSNYLGCSTDATYNGTACGNASTTFAGETINLNTTTAGSPATVASLSGVVLSNVLIVNATGNETINVANYTIVAGTIIGAIADYNNSNVNVSATYTYDSSLYTVAGSGSAYLTFQANETYLGTNLVSWIPAIIALSIGLLFIAYLMGRKVQKY